MGLLSSTSSLLLLAAILGLICANQLNLCVTSQKEMEKCDTFTDIGCVLGTSGIDCVRKINNNQANITSLDGGDIYLAGKCHNMKPIITERTENGAGYYAVAVAKQNSPITIKTLQGVKSCHTGLNKTAGWYVPASILFQNESNLLGQASAFFNQSCVPGAVPGSNLCALCTPTCERNSNNSYYGYNGAAQCLQDTEADVAFVKHLTFLTNPNRNDFKLLCEDGTTDSVENYATCHLAKVPSHAIVAKNDITTEEIDEIFDKLEETPNPVLFSKDYGKNKIFSSSTTSLATTYKSYTDYLGEDYIKALPEKAC